MDREKQIDEMAMLMSEGARPAIEDAIILYEKGYRRQSDVAREIIGEILLDHTPDIDGFFTMHETELAELKKKYTEEQK